jgi:FAD/FMN-containing dehydrogenase
VRGTVLTLGGPLLKNNAGPDWKQMFIGTCGAFGVVTEAILRVHPLPSQTAAAILVPASADAVLPLLRAMELALGPELSAFEFMSGNAIRAALDHVPQLRSPFRATVPDFAILAEMSRAAMPRGAEAALDTTFQEVLGQIMQDQPDLMVDALFGPAPQIWALRHALSEGVRHTGHLIAFDLSFRRGDVMRFLARMGAEMPTRFPDVTICDFGHIGDGAVHFNLSVPSDSPLTTDPELEAALRNWVIEVTMQGFGGSFSAEHGLGRRNQAYYDHYTPEPQKLLSRAFQSATSPAQLGSVRFG